MKKKSIVSVLLMLVLSVGMFTTTSFAGGAVAELGGKQFNSVADAIANAKDGDVINLVSDVTEDVTVNKNVVIDGGSKFTILGYTKVRNGVLQNLTLKPNPSDKNGMLLSVGSNSKEVIKLENVTVNYSATNRAGASASTLGGNNADVTINNCHFINEANNGNEFQMVKEWSYGLSFGGQAADGYIKFTNNEFNGAFRTMLPSLSGKVLIDNNTFKNSVYSVEGHTGGSEAEATVITTSDNQSSDIVITNNVFDNAGAFYFQVNIKFENNKVISDKYMHFIQSRGIIGEPVDLTKNTYESGGTSFVIVDLPVAPCVMPKDLPLVDFWVWNDTPADKRPADYTAYQYSYNEDGTITFAPKSDVALEQFLTQNNGNKSIRNDDVLKIEGNMTLPKLDVPEGRKLNIVLPKGATLNINENLDVNGDLVITGEGELKVGKDADVNISDGGLMDVDPSISMYNYGDITNDGNLNVPDNIKGDGKVDGKGETVYEHNITHVEKVAPTCTKAGNIEYWYCSNCDKYYKDSDLKIEIKKSDTVLKALGHKYENGKCKVCGVADPAYNGGQTALPNTGENSNVLLFSVIMVVAAVAIGFVVFLKKKNSEK